jgi:hypothetical protein
MKKIGIETWTGGTNYGTNLQAFALKRQLECMGYQPSIMGVVCHNVNYLKYPDVFFSYISKKISNMWQRHVVKKEEKLPVKDEKKFAIQEQIFTSFCEEEFHKLEVRNMRQWDHVKEEYFAFITGSDQIWNPEYFQNSYMLDYVREHNIKKISYASSLGVSALSKKVRKKYRKLLKSYSAISVREQSAADILQEISPVKVQVVVDPTMLLEKKEWDAFVGQAEVDPSWNAQQHYILCYFVGNKKEYWSYVDKIEKTTGYHVLTIAMSGNDVQETYQTIYNVGPREFVWLIKNASIVCTDSFHASVFSIINHREFYVLKRFSDRDKGSQNTRLYHLLHNFGLDSRFIDNAYGSFIREATIDYLLIDEKLKELRAESEVYLESALK